MHIFWLVYASCCLVTKLCSTFCDSVDCSTLGLLVLHQLQELAETHVNWVSDAIQTSHPLSPPSTLALNLSQHRGLFQWVNYLNQMAKVLELQLQHQFFQCLNLKIFCFLWLVFHALNVICSLNRILCDS